MKKKLQKEKQITGHN